MKNLMQKLVKAILCVGVVSVSLIACDPVPVESNVIDLDQIDNQITELDSAVTDSLTSVDVVKEEPPMVENEVIEGEVKEEE